MSDPAPSRPAPGDLREYLLTQFNQALRRLGMYGGEDALLLLADALAFADACQPEWNETMAQLRAHGAATSARVRGAFQRLWGDQGPNPHDAVASIYAEVALPRGWVTLDHALDRRGYDELDQSSARWADRARRPASSDLPPPVEPPAAGRRPAPGRSRRAHPAGRPPPQPPQPPRPARLQPPVRGPLHLHPRGRPPPPPGILTP